MFGGEGSRSASPGEASSGLSFALYTCAIAPTPRGCSWNSSKMSLKGRPPKALTMIRFVSARECAGAFEWRDDMVLHISVGKISDLEAAHCPSLMNAGPARSIEWTKNLYHQSVPVRSLSCSFCRRPNHTKGTAAITGTKIITRCRNLNPVAKGSYMYLSTNRYIPRPALLMPCRLSGIVFSISAREASNMCSSGVLPSPLSSSLSCTKAAGLSKASKVFPPFGPLGGGLPSPGHFEAMEKRFSGRKKDKGRWVPRRRHSRPKQRAVRIVWFNLSVSSHGGRLLTVIFTCCHGPGSARSSRKRNVILPAILG